MDIFEIAQQGMNIQEQEKKEREEEERLEKEPAYKLSMPDLLDAVSKKDYDFFNRLGENQKSFQPFMLNLWLSMVWTKNPSRAFTGNDGYYADILQEINFRLNTQVFTVSKELYWLMACAIQKYINYNEKGKVTKVLEYSIDWKKSLKKNAAEKVPKKVIDYMSKELWTSSDKIYDMIDNGLINDADIASILADLETLEDTKKKKK